MSPKSVLQFWLIVLVCLIGNSSAAIKVACVGNSITAGAYPGKLQGLLGSAYQVYGEGVGGTTMLKRGDSPYWNTSSFRDVFTVKPNIITIKLGTNDSKSFNWGPYHDQFAADYLAMIDTFLTISPRPQIWVVLCTPSFTGGSGINGDTIHQDIVPIIRTVAAARGLPIIDAHSPLLNHSECFGDGIHPTDAGADSIAHIFYRTLMGKPVMGLTDSLLGVSYEIGMPRQNKSLSLKAINYLPSVHLSGAVTITKKSSWLSVSVNAANIDSQVIVNTIDPASLPDVAARYYDTVTVHASGAAFEDLTYRISVWMRAPAVLTSISISPANASVALGQAQQFIARGLDQFDIPLETQPVFTWSTSGGGTINSSGLYTSAGCPGSYSASVSTGNLSISAAIGVTNQTAVQAATASASSATQGSPASAIKDGVADGHEGHPGDASKEWSSVGEMAGAWAQLSWTSAITLDSVALFDRPNLNDQVLSGTLSFSDGSTITVGTLPNDGTAPWGQKFASKVVTWIKFTVNSVKSTTANIGLAEFGVYNTQGCQPVAAIKPAERAIQPGALHLTGNRIVVNAAPESFWSLDLYTLNGSMVSRFTGKGSAMVSLGSSTRRVSIARLRTSAGERVEAMVR